MPGFEASYQFEVNGETLGQPAMKQSHDGVECAFSSAFIMFVSFQKCDGQTISDNVICFFGTRTCLLIYLFRSLVHRRALFELYAVSGNNNTRQQTEGQLQMGNLHRYRSDGGGWPIEMDRIRVHQIKIVKHLTWKIFCRHGWVGVSICRQDCH